MNKRMIIMLAIVVVLFGGIFGFKAFVDRMIAEAFDTMEPEAATVTASTVRQADWTPRSQAVGSFRAARGAELSVELGGTVREIHFESGRPVEEGQRLVSLVSETDEAELGQLEAARRLADLELERQERLFRQDSISRSELERAESEADQARAAVAAQEARIRLKTLRAPHDGIAGIRQVNLGQYVSAGTPVVSVQALDPIYLDFTLPQRKLPLVQTGANIQATVDAFGGEVFEGEINAVEPRLSESSRTVQVQATLANEDERLRPGMFGRVSLELGEAETVLAVPQTAIRFSTYGNSVFVIEGEGEDKQVIQRFVQTGRTRGDLIAITEGLEEGDRIASSGLLKLQNESRVRIDEQDDVQPTEDEEPDPPRG